MSSCIVTATAAMCLFVCSPNAGASQTASSRGEVETVGQLQEKIPRPALVFARSDTVFMKSATIRSWLRRQPEFGQLGLAFAADQGHADYYVEITRPALTWDWTYSVVKTKSGKILGSGKVTAATAERAAQALATKVIQILYSETSGTRAPATVSADRVSPKRFVAYEDLTRRFESAKTFAVHSLTVWFDERDLTTALKQRPEFPAWGYEVTTLQRIETSDAEQAPEADLTIEVNRPLFTWDWTFSIQAQKSKQTLASGKLTAISGPVAAPKLAQAIVNMIADARGLPSSMQQQFDKALAETNIRTWEVRHVSGQSQLKSGKLIRLAVGQDTIFGLEGEQILFSVPADDLLQFSHSSSVHDPSVKWFQAWEKAGSFISVGGDPQSAAGALMVLLPMIAVDYGVGGILKASTSTDHLLLLHWKKAAGVATLTLQGGEKEIREICAELDKFPKHASVDLDIATEELRFEFLKQLQATPYFIEIDQAVTIDDKTLLPGRYRLVIIQREMGLAEVYFLDGSNNTVVVQTLAEHRLRTDADRSCRISYITLSGVLTLQEIDFEEHILRFTPVPAFTQEMLIDRL